MTAINRRKSRKVKVRDKFIGGGAPILVQSMCNTKTHDIEATLKQINDFEERGCELVRLAMLDENQVEAFKEIRKQTEVPLCVDIHFNHLYAIKCMEYGADKVRINPGNIGSKEKTQEVVRVAKDHGVPIRIGVNSGSIRKDLIDKYGGAVPAAGVESALGELKILEDLDFYDTIVSIKYSSALDTIRAYEELAQKCDYPLHVGVTEAGTEWTGAIKSAVGIGHLLAEGIGDTIRVSLSADPLLEVDAAYEILKALRLRTHGPDLTACPTCGRTQIDLIGIAHEVEERLKSYKEPIHVAVMGCVVNGPGEAREADVGLAGGIGEGVIFRKGEVVRKVSEKELVDELFKEIDKVVGEKG